MILQKNNFKQPLKHFISLFGYKVSKLSKINHDIYKLRSIKNLKERYLEFQKLIKKYPNDPKLFLEQVHNLRDMCDPGQFEMLKEYGYKREKWLKETGFNELDIEFVESGIVFGSLGNHYALANLIRANELGLREKKKIFLIMPSNTKLRNSTLTKYFKKYINIIKGDDLYVKGSYSETNYDRTSLDSILTLPLGTCLPLKNEYVPSDIGANRCEKEFQNRKLNNPTFTLDQEDYEEGKKALKKFGLPDNAWYVTLHVREPGYRTETAKNTTESFRNCNPLNYIRAIKKIISAGGWVFRMGDSSMTPLPKINQLIDYAHSPLKSEQLDVFLLASSKFLIGTSSGPMRVPSFFGVPIMLTNNIRHQQYYSLKEKDLYLPRLIKKISDKKNLKLEQMLSMPTNLYENESQFKNAGLYWEENSPEDIEFSVMEMLDKVNQKNNSTFKNSLTKEQLKFKKIAEIEGSNYASSTEAFAPCSGHFLSNNF